MTSEKQLVANKENSLSAGVKSEDGKLRIRFNSYKHGLSSQILISNFKNLKESEDKLQLIFEAICESIRPRNALEEELIHRMALSILKGERCEALEKSNFSEELCFITNSLKLEASEGIEQAMKYKGQLDASFYRAIDTLMKLRQMQQLDLFWNGSNG
jgi:hypothetical protein